MLSTAETGRGHQYHRSVARIGQQAAEALTYAHARGVVHRDIKPANLLLDTAGVVWVADFGLAKSEDDGLTQTGDILGTLRYMAPERFRGESDARVDVYALGLTLYELLTLRPAFEASDRLRLIEEVKSREPTPPRSVDPRIPRDLETIVLKAIEKEPRRRYQTAEELAEDLRRFLADEPIRARQVGTVQRAILWATRRPAEAALAAVGSLAALALIGTAVSLWYQGQLREQRDLVSRQRDIAEKFRYFQHMAMANTAWRDGSLGRLEELLDTCPDEHKNHWEWRYLKRQCHRELRRLKGHTAPVFEVQYSRDGKSLVSAGLDETLTLWDATTGLAVRTFVGHTNSVTGVAINPKDGNQIASASWDGTVRIWDAASGREIRDPFTLEPSLPLWDVKYSPDGRRIAATCGDGSVRIWDLQTGDAIVWPFEPMPNINRRLAFSPDGTWLAVPGAGFKVNLIHTSTGQAIPLEGHQDMALGVAFSPDGRHLAAGSYDRTVRIWEVATGKRGITIIGTETRAKV